MTRLVGIRAAIVGAITAAVLASAPARATVLSDNLAAASGGTESATATRWLAAAFATDASAHTLSSVTLLLGNPVAGAAQVSIYTDGGLEPGALVGTLVAPGSYSATPAATTFTTAGIALSASTTYWVVVRPTSGTFAWSWTTSNAGTGAGFKRTWGVSEDSGTSWWTDDFYQTQMTVIVDACTSPTVTTQPSPSAGCAGRTVSLTGAAAGSPTIAYQWRKNTVALSNGGRISGADTATLTITGVVAADAGSYDCVATNSCGSATTSAAAVGVCAADVDCDGSITPTDIALFVNGWFTSLQNGTLAGDYNGDGAVTPADIAAFVNGWFGALSGGC